jgi:hypothetical protein
MLRTAITILIVAGAATQVMAQPAPGSAGPAPSLPPTPPAVTAPGPGVATAGWKIGAAARLGVAIPTSKLGSMVAGGLELDVPLPVANHQLVIAFDGTLTRPSHDGSAMDPRVPGGVATYTIHQLEFVVGVMATYRFAPAGRGLVPWLGAGPIVHLLSTRETTSLSPDANTATATKLGGELGGGLDLRAGPGFVVGELRVVYSGLDNLLAGESNAGNLVIATAYRLVF